MPAVELEYLVVMLIVVLTMATMPLVVNTQTLGNDTDCLIGLQYGWKGNSLWNNLPNTPICTTPSSSSLTGIACNNNRILSITLSSFNLSGTISPSLAYCTFLQSLDLSSNNLYDSIPSNIGNLSYLTSLNFSHNHLSTPIPPQLSACAYLNVLDLHLNLLSGPIPAQLGLLQRLKVFDVSYNQLSGYIPTTLSNTSTGAPRFNASSFVGNNDLYGYPLPPATSHSLSVLAIVGIGLASGLVSLIVSFTAVCIWLRVTEQGFAAEEGKISQLMSES